MEQRADQLRELLATKAWSEIRVATHNGEMSPRLALSTTL